MVFYKKQMILQLQGQFTGTNGQPQTLITWSTSPEYDKYIPSVSSRIPMVKTAEVDENYDGLNDYFDYTITVPLFSGESIQNVRLAFFLDYRLQVIIVLCKIS